MTIVLTAMQVGLATNELQSSQMLNRASYGFAVFSIVAPLGILLVLLLVLLFLIIFNLDHAIRKRSTTRESFRIVSIMLPFGLTIIKRSVLRMWESSASHISAKFVIVGRALGKRKRSGCSVVDES